MRTFQNDAEAIDYLKSSYHQLSNEIGQVVIGQEQVVKDVIISIFSKGHCLLVGVPGLAKTLLVTTISKVLGLDYSRIQFTPDLMPSDIIGSEILDEDRHFRFIKGPLFANIILADEINRTPPKTQAALLEAMQERAVTAAGKRFELGKPFFVLATQNPIEQEGTYPLPEAQLDRFMFNIWVDYPSFEDEVRVVKSTTSDKEITLRPILGAEEINFFQELVRRIPVSDHLVHYAVKLVAKTRPGSPYAPELVNKYLSWGAGPRASQFLILGAKCHAAIEGRYSPDIADINAVATAILRHRIIRNYKAEAEGLSVEKIIAGLLD
ncbi:MAG: MoxR family ATPase [Bacteroidia bacterium]|nr:MoxR family ATPase [Bacteroidia bacterium]MCC6769216.1 MoxR family ATPase [Bacteroidia bacterium]